MVEEVQKRQMRKNNELLNERKLYRPHLQRSESIIKIDQAAHLKLRHDIERHGFYIIDPVETNGELIARIGT